MIDLVVCSVAEAEYADALCWYAERSVSAAEQFDAEFNQAMQTIASDPERFPKCDERHHYYLMRHFPYQIIYRQHQDHWVVIAVAHTARKPNYWSGRQSVDVQIGVGSSLAAAPPTPPDMRVRSELEMIHGQVGATLAWVTPSPRPSIE